MYSIGKCEALKCRCVSTPSHYTKNDVEIGLARVCRKPSTVCLTFISHPPTLEKHQLHTYAYEGCVRLGPNAGREAAS